MVTSKRNRQSKAAYRKGGGGFGGGAWIAIAVGVAIVILVALKFALPTPSTKRPALDGKPVAAKVLSDLTSVSTADFAAAGVGDSGTSASPLPVVTTSPAWRVGGKPIIFYLGAEYCPFCAATRWSFIVATSRFGKWSGLEYMNSTANDVYPLTPTFTFLHATYASKYVTVQTVEQQGRTMGQPLQSMDAAQNAAANTYDNVPFVPSSTAGSIPFIDMANRYIWSGSVYNPQVLQGMNWGAIAAAVHSGKGPVARAILGGANVLTAGLCVADGGHPGSVCTSQPIHSLTAKIRAAKPVAAKAG